MLLQLGASEASCCFLLLLLSGCFPKLSFAWFLGVPPFALILSCAETSLKNNALPVHLPRQVFLLGSCWPFFGFFFSSLFSTSFFNTFSIDFGGVLEPQIEAKSMKDGVKIEVETHIDFYVVFSRC